MTGMMGALCRAGAIAAALVFATSANATTVDWRAGSGNTGDFFTTATGTLGGFDIEIGLRARIAFIGDVVPSGNVYTFDPGPSTVNPGRSMWNFDIHVMYGGDISTLDALSLALTTNNSATPSAPSFDLLAPAVRNAIDCHIIGCVNGAPVNPDAGVADQGAGNDGAPTLNPTNFYQASQNAVFGWYSTFDPFEVGEYGFTLTARDGTQTEVSTSMLISVVPEPASIAVLGSGLVLLGAAYRRRRNRPV